MKRIKRNEKLHESLFIFCYSTWFFWIGCLFMQIFKLCFNIWFSKLNPLVLLIFSELLCYCELSTVIFGWWLIFSSLYITFNKVFSKNIIYIKMIFISHHSIENISTTTTAFRNRLLFCRKIKVVLFLYILPWNSGRWI